MIKPAKAGFFVSGVWVFHCRWARGLHWLHWIAWRRALPGFMRLGEQPLSCEVPWLGPSGVGLWGTLQVRPCKLSRRIHAAHAPQTHPRRPLDRLSVATGKADAAAEGRHPRFQWQRRTVKRWVRARAIVSHRLFAKMREAAGRSPALREGVQTEELPGGARRYDIACNQASGAQLDRRTKKKPRISVGFSVKRMINGRRLTLRRRLPRRAAWPATGRR